MRRFYIFNLFLAIFLIFYYFLHRDEVNSTQRPLNVHYISNSSITALGDNKTFILSPYYDPRLTMPTIRVLAIIHNSVGGLYCSFHCFHGSPVIVRAILDLHSDRFRFPYGTADLLCTEPTDCPYRYISVHRAKVKSTTHLPRFEVRNRPPPAAPSVNFTVCISTMYGNYNNVLQTIQSLEMYKLLGAGRVTLYLNQCHQNLEKVLQYYVEEGILEVIPWPIHKFLRTSDQWLFYLNNNSQVHYYGQTATLNDCLYRNMYRSKFVLLNDIDEIILPVMHHDWPSLMESLQQHHPETSVFQFENHDFSTSSNDSEMNPWRDIPGVNILQSIFKKTNGLNKYKLLVDPRKVYQTSIHSVLKSEGQPAYVPRDVAINFHCRRRQQANGIYSLTEDRTLWRYKVSLLQSVNKVIQRVFFHD
uniref:Glycosyltransferase family 92 protein n=1 Tax=Leptobrachium leishanense TaxID=445787 RepID=A0A8C5MXK0_9ANUR